MKGFLFILISLGFGPVLAQTYEITPQTQRVNNVKYNGFSSKVQAPMLKVEEFWLSYLRENGKVRRKRNYYQVTEFKTSKHDLDSATLLTRVTDDDSLGVVWLTVQTPKDDAQHQDLSEVLKKFTRAYYMNEQQEKIDESEQAAIFVSKNHAKYLRESENLRLELNSAEGYKLRLEEQLENIILEIKVLNQKIIDNKAAAVEAYEDLQQIKKITEQNKADLKKIN